MSKLIHYSGPAGSYILPSGYTRLAYIQSTGSLWIDTGWTATNNTMIYAKLKPNTINDGFFFGCRDAYGGSSCFAMHPEYALFGNDMGSGKGPGSTTNLLYIKMSLTGVWINTKDPIKTYTTKTFTNTNTMLIGCTSQGSNTKYTINQLMNIYKFSIWEGNIIKRDMVPVQTTSTVTSADGTSCPNGSIGLLDLVENKFYLNKGTGTFIAGPECPQGFPTSEYCLVEWLEGTGTLYINTGINYDSTNNNYRIQSRFQMTDVIRNYQAVYGAYTSESHNCFRLLRWNSNTAFGYGSNSLAGGGGTSVKVDSIFDEFEVDHTYNTGILINITRNKSTTTTIGHTSGTTTTGTFFLFAQNTNSGTTSAIRISYWKIYNDSTLVSYMIPCYRRSDIKPGMYDIVRREFYTNSGTGEFLLGPSITFGWGEVTNSAPNSSISYPAIPHNISSGEGRMGEKNGSFDFDRNQLSCLTTDDNIPINSNGSYTIALKFKALTYPTNTAALYTLGGGNTVNFADNTLGLRLDLIDELNGKLKFAVINGGKFHYVYKNINTNQWYSAIVVKNGTNIKFYLDREKLLDVTSSGTTNKGNILRIGNIDLGTRALDGYIQDFQVWNEAITDITSII